MRRFDARRMLPPILRPYTTPAEAEAMFLGTPAIALIVTALVSLFSPWANEWWWWLASAGIGGTAGTIVSGAVMRRVRARMEREKLP